MSVDKYVLTSNGLYYSASITTTTPTLQSSFTGGKLIRRVAGVDGGVVVYRTVNDSKTFTGSFTSGFDDHVYEATDIFGFDPDNADAVWSASGGRTDAGCLISQAPLTVQRSVPLVVDLGGESVVTAVTAWLKGDPTASPGNADTFAVYRNSDLGTEANKFPGVWTPNSTYTQKSYGAGTDTHWIYILAWCETGRADLVYVDDVSISYSVDDAVVAYSDDFGATWTEQTVDVYGKNLALDVDDFNLGIIIMAARRKLYFSSTYGGAFTEITGLTDLDFDDRFTSVRVPFLKHTGANNNNSTALQFVYATKNGVLKRATLNASTGAATAVDISKSGYYVIGVDDSANGNAIVVNGSNAVQIAALMKPTSGGSTRLFATSDAGANWQDRGAFNGTYIDIVPTTDGGENGEFVVAGSGGLRHAASFNSSLQNRDGDFGSELAGDALGMIAT